MQTQKRVLAIGPVMAVLAKQALRNAQLDVAEPVQGHGRMGFVPRHQHDRLGVLVVQHGNMRDLGPGLLGAPSPTARFFLVADRRIANTSERCAIPVQGECELFAGVMLPPLRAEDDSIAGCLDINGDLIDVLDLEKTIANCARIEADAMSRAEAIS